MTARIRIRDNTGTLRTVARIRMRDETSTLRTIQRVRIRDTSGTLQTVFQYLVVTTAPSPINTSVSVSTGTTPPATATVTGGTAPFTYSWINLYGDPIQINTPTAASTTFRKTGMLSGDVYQASFACVVTDALGASATSSAINVLIERT